MEPIIVLFVLFAIFLAVRYKNWKPGLPPKIKALKYTRPWSIVFFDKNLWIKAVLIGLLKTFVFIASIFTWLIAKGLRIGYELISKKK